MPLFRQDSFAAPAIIARAGPSTRKKIFEFFTVPIRNANTRAAYYRAIQQFLAWAERAGYQDLMLQPTRDYRSICWRANLLLTRTRRQAAEDLVPVVVQIGRERHALRRTTSKTLSERG